MVTYTGNYIINNIHSINSTCKVHYVTGDVHYVMVTYTLCYGNVHFVTGDVHYVMVSVHLCYW